MEETVCVHVCPCESVSLIAAKNKSPVALIDGTKTHEVKVRGGRNRIFSTVSLK